jgi:hypothetical protein
VPGINPNDAPEWQTPWSCDVLVNLAAAPIQLAPTKYFAPPTSPVPTGSPVERHGALQVQGNKILGKHGKPVVLRGMSLFWSQWAAGSKYYTRDTVRWLKDDWHVDVVRAAMAVEHGGYLSNPSLERERAETVCDAAIEFGIYCIMDYHAHYADEHETEAKDFFTEMAKKYKNTPNIIFETFNEPVFQDWDTVIKPYHEAVLGRIREYSPNLAILGSAFWSQSPDVASRNPITSYSNVAYTLHFYAGTHFQEHASFLWDKVIEALRRGVPIFATEWGTCEAENMARVYPEATRAWLDFLEQHDISHANWAIGDKDEACAALKVGAPPDGWSLNQLTESGTFMRNLLRDHSTRASLLQIGTTSTTPSAPTTTTTATSTPPQSLSQIGTTSTTPSAPTTTTTTTAPPACTDVLTTCQKAQSEWQMCVKADDWWRNQCRATCGLCPVTTPIAKQQSTSTSVETTTSSTTTYGIADVTTTTTATQSTTSSQQQSTTTTTTKFVSACAVAAIPECGCDLKGAKWCTREKHCRSTYKKWMVQCGGTRRLMSDHTVGIIFV